MAIEVPVYMCLVTRRRGIQSSEVSSRVPGMLRWSLLKQGESCVCISSSNLGDVGKNIMHFFFVTNFVCYLQGHNIEAQPRTRVKNVPFGNLEWLQGVNWD